MALASPPHPPHTRVRVASFSQVRRASQAMCGAPGRHCGAQERVLPLPTVSHVIRRGGCLRGGVTARIRCARHAGCGHGSRGYGPLQGPPHNGAANRPGICGSPEGHVLPATPLNRAAALDSPLPGEGGRAENTNRIETSRVPSRPTAARLPAAAACCRRRLVPPCRRRLPPHH